ncbi:hypothetical protein TSTA_081440 [Talaromyces stipitatus ATCC 10500]|uniref:Uncharacterized protein n=1 Tax=Talaromyces stipitatus (strain ATCC 10500 / CBS 375.48 / QM 6759 / NRRL 1006) TaxID=441959 RepID=B8LZX9_TALSN|nr:uncharacterized protein TSTA_081440 [Talaromyces stipitatus ATCC 10500]EED20911.1 hypothetical protein TSTA_081440 [Talaromyces stipitatus ATCC 10500]
MIKEQRERSEESEYLLLAAYANELEWTAGKSGAESRYTRNVIIHGGDIKYAIRAIEFLEELGELQPIIATVPEEIVDVLNKRGILQKPRMWEDKFPKERTKWIKDCDQVIKAWLHTGEESYREDEVKEKRFRLSQWMADRVEDIKRRS